MSDPIEKVKEENVGKWVAVKDNKLVAVSVDFNEVIKKIKERKFSGTYIFYSPKPEEKKYGYLFVIK